MPAEVRAGNSAPAESVISIDKPEGNQQPKIFGVGTAEFNEALDKIPPRLLELLESQFRAKPAALVTGGIINENENVHPSAQESEISSFGDDLAELEEDDESD